MERWGRREVEDMVKVLVLMRIWEMSHYFHRHCRIVRVAEAGRLEGG